jgi:serine/threonine-protein kinase HipA
MRTARFNTLTELDIYFHEQLCGWLRIDNERMQFQYHERYITQKHPPLSVAMPVREEPWPDAVSFPFFENLLPEGRVRQLLANRLHTADNNFSRLLHETGGEVAGAISIVPHDHALNRSNTPNALTPALSERELGVVLKQIETQPFLQGNNTGMRLSLAGAQNKLPVVIDAQNGIHLPDNQTSTHIIKPPSAYFPSLVENEFFCMRAAARAGLNVPAVKLQNFIMADGRQQDCYVIERYDRITNHGKTLRLHQEDMCQVLSVPSPQKYVQDGGPSFAQVFAMLRKHSRPPALHQQELIRRILFNMLIGNQDAHGKNFALLHLENGIVLAPAYDIVSTLVYPELQQRFAMPIGQAWRVEELDKSALDEFQTETKINLRRQSRMLRLFLERAVNAVEEESSAVKRESSVLSDTCIDQIVDIAQRHAGLIDRWLA